MLLAAVLIAFLGLGGCGRKGDPLPPIIEVPETTTDLAVRQEGTEAVLTWSFPQLTRAGRQLVDLERVEVWKLDVPPGQEQVGSGPSGVELRRQLMLGRGRLIERLQAPMLQAATRGSMLELRDPLPQAQTGQTQPAFWYAVRSRRRDGTLSALSNIVSWQVKAVPPAVQGVVATPGPMGISVAWQAPGCQLTSRSAREATSQTWDVAAGGLVSGTPGHGRQAQRHLGLPRASRRRPGVRDLRARRTVDFPDIYPPQVAQNLICLPEGRCRPPALGPAPEPEVMYRVFRKQGDLWIHLIDDGREPEFADQAPPARGRVRGQGRGHRRQRVGPDLHGAGRAVRYLQAPRCRQRLPGLRRHPRSRAGGAPSGAGCPSVPPAPGAGGRRRAPAARRPASGRPVSRTGTATARWRPFCANGTRCAARFAAVRWGWSELQLHTGFATVPARVRAGEVELALPAPARRTPGRSCMRPARR